MRRHKRHCRCKKCTLKLEVTNSLGELIPGPQGPVGPPGRVIAEVPRSLKVQMIGSEIMPIIIQGFSWEADVLQPPGWPVPGTFTFYRATVLDQEGFSVAEMFNNYGGINHTQVDEVHTSVLAHYHTGELQDLHSVSSQTPGSENFLLAQTLHDVVINDQLYFAISPNVSSLTTFNYTLGSVKIKNSITLTPGNNISFGGTSLTVVLQAQSSTSYLSFDVVAASGGGGAGDESTNGGGMTKIGRGGGGGAISWIAGDIRINPPLKNGDILELSAGFGGAGGTASDPDGKSGRPTSIIFNRAPADFSTQAPFPPNPFPGGNGGKGGINGGDGAAGTGSPSFGGGGGGAPVINGITGSPGPGGSGDNPGQSGDTNPRKGGDGAGSDGGAGGPGGTPTSRMGSGGGGGSSTTIPIVGMSMPGGPGGAGGGPSSEGAGFCGSVYGGGGGSGALPQFSGGGPNPGGDGAQGFNGDIFVRNIG